MYTKLLPMQIYTPLRLHVKHVYLIDQSPKSHAHECQRNAGDSCLSTLHPKETSAPENLCLLRLQLRVAGDIAVDT